MGQENGQPDDGTGRNHNDPALRVIHHKVTVTGNGGVAATVMITVRRGQVWLSIQPPFTWDAIMRPGKVDELVRTLGLAAEEAKKMVSGKSGSGDNRQPDGNGTVSPVSEFMCTTKEEQ